MFSQVILIGCIMGIIVTIYVGSYHQPKHFKSQTLTVEEKSDGAQPNSNRNYDYVPDPWRWIIEGNVIHNAPWANSSENNSGVYNRRGERNQRIPDQIQTAPSGMQQTKERTANTLAEHWRKSIVGLVKLAEKNLESAKERMKTGDFKAAVQNASTSVENIARALIHCYGGKPDTTPCQEEALRMLSRRFSGDEKTVFEKAVNEIARIGYSETGLQSLSTQKLRFRFLCETKAKQTLESASKIVNLFKRIITDHFAEEIQELRSTFSS